MAESAPTAEPNTITVENAVSTTPTTTSFSLDSFSKPTPMWAKNAFIVFYSMNASIIAYLGLTKILAPNDVIELVLLFKFILDPLCYIISKMWGVTPIDVPSKQ